MHTYLTDHAKLRCIQWNITHEEVDFIVSYAKSKHHGAGAIFFHLHRKDLPVRFSREDRYTRLVGTTIVACKYCEVQVITVYRYSQAFKADKRKRKYDIKKESHYCPCCDNEIAA